MAEESSSRWWEFYAVRYAVGTAFGGLFVFLFFNMSPVLKKLLFLGPAYDDGGEQASHAAVSDAGLAPDQLVLYGIFGLFFCLLSSAPALVLHATRAVEAPWGKRASSGRFLSIIVLTTASAIAWNVFFIPETQNGIACVKFAAAWVFLFVVVAQACRMLEVVRQIDLVYCYAKRLSLKRKEAKIAGLDIVESYRQLRDHGNSLMIVLLEMVLGVSLLILTGAIDKILDPSLPEPGARQILLITFLMMVFWLLPGCCAWILGMQIERRFVDDASS